MNISVETGSPPDNAYGETSEAVIDQAPDHDKNPFALAFGNALTMELDSIGYPANPKRSSTLASDLSIGRAQSYKLLKGTSVPTLEALAILRGKGCSIDRLLDAVNGKTDSISLEIDGRLVSALIQSSLDSQAASVFVEPTDHGKFALRLVNKGLPMPKGAIPISGLRFPLNNKNSIALLDDDPNILDVMGRSLSESFHVTPFSTGRSLLEVEVDLGAFSALIIDWRLPDIKGEDLISTLRARTAAPIFILTGDTSESHAIARVLDYPNIHHVRKPADEVILIKLLAHAIG